MYGVTVTGVEVTADTHLDERYDHPFNPLQYEINISSDRVHFSFLLSHSLCVSVLFLPYLRSYPSFWVFFSVFYVVLFLFCD